MIFRKTLILGDLSPENDNIPLDVFPIYSDLIHDALRGETIANFFIERIDFALNVNHRSNDNYFEMLFKSALAESVKMK